MSSPGSEGDGSFVVNTDTIAGAIESDNEKEEAVSLPAASPEERTQDSAPVEEDQPETPEATHSPSLGSPSAAVEVGGDTMEHSDVENVGDEEEEEDEGEEEDAAPTNDMPESPASEYSPDPVDEGPESPEDEPEDLDEEAGEPVENTMAESPIVQADGEEPTAGADDMVLSDGDDADAGELTMAETGEAAGDEEFSERTTAAGAGTHTEGDLDSAFEEGAAVDPVSPAGTAAEPAPEANADLMDAEEQNTLIANIFGDSDDEDGDFLGFDVDAMAASKRHHGDDSDSDDGVIDPLSRRDSSTAGHASDNDEDDVIDDGRAQPNASGMSDFDLMMERKKAGRKKRRKKGDAITGMDDYVHSFICEMRAAAEEDKRLNERDQAATKKLKMLPSVLRCLNQVDLMGICLDLGVLPVVALWLNPLPDGSLPHVTIRDGLLTWLCMLPDLQQDHLKTSNIGKAVMFLYRHPKETRQNRQRAGSLISNWSRMIFGLQANYKLMSRDEREERDYLHMQRQQRRKSSDGQDESGKQPGLLGESGQALKPGDRGFVGRARVPMPSNKDYIVRPKWNVDQEASRKEKREPNRFEKQQMKQKQQKQVSKTHRAAAISVVGSKMAL